MADDRRAKTMQLSGNDYAKVAERLRLFRTDWPNGKSETDHFYKEDGQVEFKAWLWKDKSTLIELMKSGVTDKHVLRSSADADGDAKGKIGEKNKDFEKLQTIAMGRALANLGYLGSGEVASFEEMQEYERLKQQEADRAIADAVERLGAAKTLDELKEIFVGLGSLVREPRVIDAKDERKAELGAGQPNTPPPAKKPPQAPKKAEPGVAKQVGMTQEQADMVLDKYDREHPGVAEASKGLKLDENDRIVPEGK